MSKKIFILCKVFGIPPFPLVNGHHGYHSSVPLDLLTPLAMPPLYMEARGHQFCNCLVHLLPTPLKDKCINRWPASLMIFMASCLSSHSTRWVQRSIAVCMHEPISQPRPWILDTVETMGCLHAPVGVLYEHVHMHVHAWYMVHGTHMHASVYVYLRAHAVCTMYTNSLPC